MYSKYRSYKNHYDPNQPRDERGWINEYLESFWED